MITAELFERLFPSKGLSPKKYNLVAKRQELIDNLNKFLPLYGIDSYRRVCAFLATCGVETDYFKTTEEYASGNDYEGRKDLKNTQKGDGRRFKGRGIIQTTGRGNYTELQKITGETLGVDFVKDPTLLNLVPFAVESACVYWKVHNLNHYADRGPDPKQFKKLNGKVNRGNEDLTPLHWTKRNELYSKCLRYVPKDFRFEQTPEEIEFAEGIKPIDITPEMEAKFSSAADMAKGPNVKIVAGKIAGKVGGPLALAWSTTTGKILTVLTISLLLAGLAYLGYLYRKQINIGWETAKAYFKKKVGLSQ